MTAKDLSMLDTLEVAIEKQVVPKSRAMTDIVEIRDLLTSLIVATYNAVVSDDKMTEAEKIHTLFELTTGVERCGRVDGLDDVSDLENLLYETTKVSKSHLFKSSKMEDTMVHVFELFVPRERRATTEWATVNELGKLGLANKVTVDSVDKNWCLRAPDVAPVLTNFYHFVVLEINGEKELHSWAPGKYRSPDVSNGNMGSVLVRVGYPRLHEKVQSEKAKQIALEDIRRAATEHLGQEASC